MKINIIFCSILLFVVCQLSYGQNGDTILDFNNLIGSWQYKNNVDAETRLFYRKDEKNKKIYFGQTINIFENGSFTEQRTVPCGNDNGWRYKSGFWKIENKNVLKLEYSKDSTFVKHKILKLDSNELSISEVKLK